MLGYAFMGRAHAHALITLAHMTGPPAIAPRLVVVAGRDEAARTAFAERFGFERHAADWAEVVADPRRPGAREPAAQPPARRADHHGRAPASTWSARSPWRWTPRRRGMLDAVREAGVVHMCAFNYRFVPAVRRARELLEAGELGEVRHFRGVYRQSWGADPAREGIWRFDPAQAGGGALGDLASHVVDLARYLVGEIETVAAQVATFVPGREVDDAVAAAVSFAGGAIGTIEATRFATGSLNRFTWEINGSRGSLASTSSA